MLVLPWIQREPMDLNICAEQGRQDSKFVFYSKLTICANRSKSPDFISRGVDPDKFLNHELYPYENQLIESYRILQNSMENFIEWVYRKIFLQISIENVTEWVYRKLFLQNSIESIYYLSLFLFLKKNYRNSYILTLIQMMRVHEKPFYTKIL